MDHDPEIQDGLLKGGQVQAPQALLPLEHGACKLPVEPLAELLEVVEVVVSEAAGVAHEAVGELDSPVTGLAPGIKLAFEVGRHHLGVLVGELGVGVLLDEEVKRLEGDLSGDCEGGVEVVEFLLPSQDVLDGLGMSVEEVVVGEAQRVEAVVAPQHQLLHGSNGDHGLLLKVKQGVSHLRGDTQPSGHVEVG